MITVGPSADLFYIKPHSSWRESKGLFLTCFRPRDTFTLAHSPDAAPTMFTGFFHGVPWICYMWESRGAGKLAVGKWEQDDRTLPSVDSDPEARWKRSNVRTLAAQTGLQSSVKALLPVCPSCLSSLPYPALFDFRWGGRVSVYPGVLTLLPPPHVFLVLLLFSLVPEASGVFFFYSQPFTCNRRASFVVTQSCLIWSCSFKSSSSTPSTGIICEALTFYRSPPQETKWTRCSLKSQVEGRDNTEALAVICCWKQRFCGAIKLPLDMENWVCGLHRAPNSEVITQRRGRPGR